MNERNLCCLKQYFITVNWILLIFSLFLCRSFAQSFDDDNFGMVITFNSTLYYQRYCFSQKHLQKTLQCFSDIPEASSTVYQGVLIYFANTFNNIDILLDFESNLDPLSDYRQFKNYVVMVSCPSIYSSTIYTTNGFGSICVDNFLSDKLSDKPDFADFNDKRSNSEHLNSHPMFIMFMFLVILSYLKKNLINESSIIFVLLLLSINNFSNAQLCTSIPLSLSNIVSCTNGACYPQTSALINLNPIDNSTGCVIFLSPDPTTPATQMNLTTNSAGFNFPITDFYDFDDPYIGWSWNCACNRLTTIYGPGNCPPTGNITGATWVSKVYKVEHSGNMGNYGCPNIGSSAGPGTLCFQGGFWMHHRFKMLLFENLPLKSVEVAIDTPYDTAVLNYGGIPVGIMGFNNSINITLLSDTMVNPLSSACIIFDRASPTDYYIFPLSMCNIKLGYDPAKFGYFKYYSSPTNLIDPNLQVDAELFHCWDSVVFRPRWINTADTLTRNRNKLSVQQNYLSYLIDADFNQFDVDLWEEPYHTFTDFSYIAQGFMFQNSGQGPYQPGFFGITFAQPGTIQYFTPPSLVTSIGNQVVRNCLIYGTNQTLNTTWYQSVNPLVLSWAVPSTSIYFLFPNNSISSVFSILAVQGGVNMCSSFSFYMYSWPEFQYSQFTYNISGFFQQTVYSENFLAPQNQSSQFIVKNNLGSLQALITFTGQAITFPTLVSASPVFGEARVDRSGLIIIRIYSMNQAGYCYVASSNPGNIASVQIALGTIPADYTFQLIGLSYVGDLTLIFQCYQNQVSYTLRGINYMANETRRDKEQYVGPGTDGQKVGWKFPWNNDGWIPDWLKNILFLGWIATGFIWADYLINIILYVLIYGAIIVIIYLIFVYLAWPLTKFIWCWFIMKPWMKIRGKKILYNSSKGLQPIYLKKEK